MILNRKIYIGGLIATLSLFYLPLLLALRSLSSIKTFGVAPLVALIESVRNFALAPGQSILLIAAHLILFALVLLPIRQGLSGVRLGPAIIGWASLVIVLLWSLFIISAGA